MMYRGPTSYPLGPTADAYQARQTPLFNLSRSPAHLSYSHQSFRLLTNFFLDMPLWMHLWWSLESSLRGWHGRHMTCAARCSIERWRFSLEWVRMLDTTDSLDAAYVIW